MPSPTPILSSPPIPTPCPPFIQNKSKSMLSSGPDPSSLWYTPSAPNDVNSSSAENGTVGFDGAYGSGIGPPGPAVGSRTGLPASGVSGFGGTDGGGSGSMGAGLAAPAAGDAPLGAKPGGGGGP